MFLKSLLQFGYLEMLFVSGPRLYTSISFSRFLFNPEVKNTKVHQEMNTPECSNLFDSLK